MLSTLASLTFWQAKNRIRVRLARLKQPRYLVGSMAGIAYIGYFAILRNPGFSRGRGAAAAIAEILPGRGTMKFAGVGNISGAICRPGTTRHAVSLNGTLGHQAREFREYTYPWEPDAVLVMHSDGLGSRWSLDDYPGLRLRHPGVIAAVLYRDFTRQRDDITVVIGREAA